MNDPFERRIHACQDRLETTGCDVVVLFPSPNLTYATGLVESPSERVFLLFVPRAGDPVVVAPTMYGSQLADSPIEDVRLWDDGDDLDALLEGVFDDLGIDESAELMGDSSDSAETLNAQTQILVDDRMWAVFTQQLQALRPNATYGLASTVFEPLRVQKDERVLEALRQAGTLADRVALEIRERGSDVIGMTEAALAIEIERLLERRGGIDPAFETIVAAGENGANPHHHPGDREIRQGEPVVLDFGAFVRANLESGAGLYPGDQTRTIVFDGEPSETVQQVHDVVRRAQAAAIEAVEPGIPAESIDRAARSVIEDAGFGDAFVHRTGHGVGLEVHEPPYIVDGNERQLESGMVFSVEPGVYLEGEFGVRIEDLVVVTDDGCERVNESPRGW